MDSIKIDDFINGLRDKSISLFTLGDISKLFEVKEITIKTALKRFQNKGVVSKLARNKYLFELAVESPSQYQIANFICQPSYISLETAMSLRGIIDQFSYVITSVTSKKSRKVNYNGLTFDYTHINRNIFTDYIKQDSYLIATNQKAVFDYWYLAYKNSRSRNNLGLINIKKEDLKVLIEYINKNIEMKNKGKFISYIKKNYDK
ncbi:MAG: hypothetical protein PHR98_03465 [Candidatus Shapirobacteria bacterium]|jgi:predicted transcriptional regulator of viral defense system|nr:hypothetical protein [Candidatus Shapirobacteria bacterium]